jgi:hypothetical protein
VSWTNLARACGSSQNQACTASQSTDRTGNALSPTGNQLYPASNGNDGLFDAFTHTGGASGVCNEFPADLTPWWKVDLGYTASIGGGQIWGRSDGSQARLDGFQIWVGDSGSAYNAAGNTKCYTSTTFEHRTSPFTHSFDCVATGRYLWVVLETGNCLSIREIQVYSIGEKSFLSQYNDSDKSDESSMYGSSEVRKLRTISSSSIMYGSSKMRKPRII